MIDYIKEAIADISAHMKDHRIVQQTRYAALAQELRTLDTREFEPAYRFRFMHFRRGVEYCALPPVMDSARATRFLLDEMDKVEQAAILSGLTEVIDHYVGSAALASRIEFPFIRNAALRVLVERDYRDLTLRLFPSQAWKSTVILAGSILEAVLYDLLTRDAARVAQAMAAKSAPTKGPKASKRPRDLTSTAFEDQWNLSSFIDVADELGLLPAKWAAGIHTVLREFRNYVHPRLELAIGPITEGDAYQSVGALMRVGDHIRSNHP